MKRISLTLLLALFFVAGAHAQQSDFKPELTIGPSFGMNFSTFTFNPKVDTKFKQGITAGVAIRINTEKNLGLQAEINYSQQGWEEEFDDPQYSFSRTLSYVEVPFMTHIYFGGKRSKFFINLGPMVGYYMSGSTKSQLDGFESDRPTEQHTKEVQNKFQWGLGGGPGYELRTGIGNFLLEGRYYYMFGDIYKTNKDVDNVFSKASGQVFSIRLTYLFPILK